MTGQYEIEAESLEDAIKEADAATLPEGNFLDYQIDADGISEQADLSETDRAYLARYLSGDDGVFANPNNYIPDGCNPENQFGKGRLWDLFDNEGRMQVQRIDVPEDGSEPLESDDIAEEFARQAGYKFDEQGFIIE